MNYPEIIEWEVNAVKNNLKPCPFCGGRALPKIVRGEKYKAVCIECEGCGARGPIIENKLITYWKPCAKTEWLSQLDQAIYAHGGKLLDEWNRRAT